MSAMNVNASTYVVSVSTSSVAATLTDGDAMLGNVVIYNAGSSEVFITSAPSSATAVFPTSASVPLYGVVLAGGATATYTKSQGHKSIAMIRSTGTGNVYISAGFGE